MVINLRFRQWFTGPVTYEEATDALAPELDDTAEYIEARDYVRIERTVRRSDAAPEYGIVRRVNADVQYALVELDVSGYFEWFSINEVFLVLKSAALETATAHSAEAEHAV